jgi:hypothetical protein
LTVICEDGEGDEEIVNGHHTLVEVFELAGLWRRISCGEVVADISRSFEQLGFNFFSTACCAILSADCWTLTLSSSAVGIFWSGWADHSGVTRILNGVPAFGVNVIVGGNPPLGWATESFQDSGTFSWKVPCCGKG